ncbi:MAG TPA: hypothetical protein VGM10_32715 [Actinocrinis sp.]|jgi:hypothetical protein
MAPTAGDLLVPIIALAVLVVSGLWVYSDAASHAERGRPVFFSAGSLEIRSPGVWAIGSLVLWVFFLPLYLTCRKNAR